MAVGSCAEAFMTGQRGVELLTAWRHECLVELYARYAGKIMMER
jgi:hypothetical protein